MLLVWRDVGVDLDIDVAVHCTEARQPWQQQLAGKKWRHLQAHDRAAESYPQLFGDRLEAREHRVDVFQIVRAGFGQREGSRAAIEQRQAEFVFEHLDLVTDGRSGDTQLVGGSLEATALGCDLKSLQKP